MVSKKNKLLRWTTFGLKGLVFISTFYFLYEALLTDNALPETWLLLFLSILRKGEGLYILLAMLLIFLNWGLEAKKWQSLAHKVEKINFWQAYRAVLIGVCLGFITPNRVGDYAGRVMVLRSRQRLEGLGAVFLGRFCQLFITVATGSVSIFYFLTAFFNFPLPVTASVAIGLFIVNAALALLLFRPQILVAALSVIPSFKKFIRYVAVISLYSTQETRHLLLLSWLRYLVFVGQFMLLLKAFGVPVSWWQMALGVSGTFLLKSVVPSLSALSDLGMRELSAIYFFSLLGQNKIAVMSASLSLWFINIALPTFVGLTLVAGTKWRLNKEKKIKALVKPHEE